MSGYGDIGPPGCWYAVLILAVIGIVSGIYWLVKGIIWLTHHITIT